LVAIPRAVPLGFFLTAGFFTPTQTILISGLWYPSQGFVFFSNSFVPTSPRFFVFNLAQCLSFALNPGPESCGFLFPSVFLASFSLWSLETPLFFYSFEATARGFFHSRWTFALLPPEPPIDRDLKATTHLTQLGLYFSRFHRRPHASQPARLSLFSIPNMPHPSMFGSLVIPF